MLRNKYETLLNINLIELRKNLLLSIFLLEVREKIFSFILNFLSLFSYSNNIEIAY